MTIYFLDIASYQAGINLSEALAVAIKVTEGGGYLNPAWAAELAEAERAGAFPVPYHFLHGGNAAAQADWCHAHAGSRPLMLDVEATSGASGGLNPRSDLARDMAQRGVVSRPGISDMTTFIDRYRALGGNLHLDYLPYWYWQSLGYPSCLPLAARGMLLWSSAYTAYTDAPSGAGWQPYGGRTPTIWQYSSSTPFGGQRVDFSAFRGSVYAGKQDPASVAACLAELKSLATAGRWPVPENVATYAAPLSAHATGGKTSVTLSWVHAPVPAGWKAPYAKAFIYKGHGAAGLPNIVASYPRPPVPGASHLYGGLDPKVTGTHEYTAHIVATAPDGSRARDHAYATVQFAVSG